MGVEEGSDKRGELDRVLLRTGAIGGAGY